MLKLLYTVRIFYYVVKTHNAGNAGLRLTHAVPGSEVCVLLGPVTVVLNSWLLRTGYAGMWVPMYEMTWHHVL